MIGGIDRWIVVVIEGIIRLFRWLIGMGIVIGNEGMGLVWVLKMFMVNKRGIRNVGRCIIE